MLIANCWIDLTYMPPLALDDVSITFQPLYSPYSSENITRGAQIVNHSSMAALTFLLWDILITFDDEVKYIWARTWSHMKISYFLIRYLPMLVQISLLPIGSKLTLQFHFTPHDCFIWQVYQGVASVVIIASVDVVLVLRVYALYHSNRKVRCVVAILFLAEIAGMISGLALSLPGIRYDDVCLNAHIPGTLAIYVASSIIFQFFLFGLTLAKFVEALRSGWGDIPLIKLLVRDGTWAFFLLFCVYVGQLCLYLTTNHDYAGVLFGWLLTTFSFCGYRVLINLQHFGEQVQGTSRSNPRSRTHHKDVNAGSTTGIESTAPFTSNFDLSGGSLDGAGALET